MISIQTNVNSLVAQQNLSVNSAFQSKTIAQLTSGYRINTSGDDAAGLAVANKFRSSVAELTQGVANGNDAVAQLQIMDGGMSNIAQILDRLKTLATQSASGTFTGDRTILNKEFQGDVGEIDRQAQSIGLDAGGIFAKNLAVYLGQGSGSKGLMNATIGVDLSKSMVDSQSLGLKGMQAVVGTADLGNSSATSVSKILSDATNLSAVSANLGSTIFEFSGAGFSNVKVSVNVSGVPDLNGLVKAINGAIQNEGNGGTTVDTALKAAGVVASIHTDMNGGQQLAFTSSTSAFQVAAGDRMANALMGNFSSGATGASLATTVIGQATTAGALTAGKTIEVKIGGDDFASQTIALATGVGAGKYSTGAAAVADLMSEINTGLKSDGVTASAAGAALKAAGISVALGGVNNDQLVFTNANNSKFTVQVSGDTGTAAAGGSNVLGLGSSLSGAGNAVTYSTIVAGTAYDLNAAGSQQGGQTIGAQTTLEFSVSGGPAIKLNSIALDGGDATGGTNTSAALGTNGFAVKADGSNSKLTFNLDGKVVTTTLSANTNDGKAVVTGSGGTFVADYSGAHGGMHSFLVDYNGSIKTITLNGNDANIDNVVTDLQGKLNAAFAPGDIVVGKNGAGTALTLTTKTAGLDTSLTLAAAAGDTTLTDLGFSAGTQNGTAHTAADIAVAMNTAIANAQLATDPTTGTVGTLYNPLSSSPAATVTVNTSNQIVITNNTAGADHYISTMSGNAAATLWGADTLSNNAVTATQAHGTNRTLDSLVSAINLEIGRNSTLTAAGLQASNAGGSLQIASTNSTTFQLNMGAAEAKGNVVGTVDLSSGADFSLAPVTLKLSTDGGLTTTTVNLNQNNATANDILAELNGKLGGSGATASLVSVNGKNYIKLASNTGGAANSLQLQAGTGNAALGLTAGTYSGTNEVDLGFGSVSGKSFVGNAGINGGVSNLTGVSASGSAQTGGLTFSAIGTGLGTQSLTISANDSTGAMQATTITLAATNSGVPGLGNDGSASTIEKAVAYINSQLQRTNNATLQGIVAVEQNVNGSPEINFISALSHFQVSTGSNANGGLNGGMAETAAGEITGTGSTIGIDTQAGAMAAVSAIAAAIGQLGTAQAAVGKGQNQLTYAISLAQSQITNFSAAESQIRDANVAQQAANLSKAQVLSQASIAAMAQANSAPQAVLSLLKG